MAASQQALVGESRAREAFATISSAALRPLHVLVVAPSILFLATLGLMLFHAPDGPAFVYDRLALTILIVIVFLRACVLQRQLWVGGSVIWPLFALLLLALHDGLGQPYSAEIWSVFAAKWFVPIALYVAATHIFRSEIELHQFETFALLAFAYLSLTSIFFMIGFKALIFPRFILDDGLGIHADRARGPFLQAVANGLAINLLGLLVLNSFRRGRLRGIWALLVMIALPLAILATKTRAVWLSFGVSIIAVVLLSPSHRLRRACLTILVSCAVAVAAVVSLPDHHRWLGERLQENGPVEFRMIP